MALLRNRVVTAVVHRVPAPSYDRTDGVNEVLPVHSDVGLLTLRPLQTVRRVCNSSAAVPYYRDSRERSMDGCVVRSYVHISGYVLFPASMVS